MLIMRKLKLERGDNMKDNTLIKNTLDNIPTANSNAKRIVGLVKQSGRVTGYKLSDESFVDKAQAVTMAKQGKIAEEHLDTEGYTCYNNQAFRLNVCEPLAQLAEHLTFNQRVRGSNPRWFTTPAVRVFAHRSFLSGCSSRLFRSSMILLTCRRYSVFFFFSLSALRFSASVAFRSAYSASSSAFFST